MSPVLPSGQIPPFASSVIVVGLAAYQVLVPGEPSPLHEDYRLEREPTRTEITTTTSGVVPWMENFGN